MVIALSPMTLHFASGVSSYWKGEAAIFFTGYPSCDSRNIDPTLRCQHSSTGCCVYGGEFIANASNNAGVRLMILLFGPMKGSYLGPYPTKEEALRVASSGTPVDVAELARGNVPLNGRAVGLAATAVTEFLVQTEWSIALYDGSANGEDLRELGPITASVFEKTCLILRIPTRLHCRDLDQVCAGLALFDTVTGKMFAWYREDGLEDCPSLLRYW
jgi:hypothetical protein